MSQSLLLKIKGLYTSVNEFSEAPEGALLVADNIDIVKDSVAEPRRGFARLNAAYPDLSDRTDKNWFYQAKQFAHHGVLSSASTVSFLDSGVWTAVGTFSAPTNARMRTLEANQNLYFSSSTGVQKLDAYNGTAALAGAFKALDLQSTTTGASGWLTNNWRTAHRVVWGIRDANSNLVLGAPSARESIKNVSGGTRNVAVTFTIPVGVTTAWFYQVYRAAAVDNTSLDVEPNDEMGLVYEASPTGAEITAGTVTVTDIVPDALRGATIYTASSQDGLANQNERPPLCRDMATFRDAVFYANTVSKHRFTLTLLAVGGTNGIANDDTLTVGGVTYTGKASETIASGFFAVVTGGSASQNIRDTALSLIRVINRRSASTVYAYYLSGPDDKPGKILLEERGIGGASFALTSSRASCWNPELASSGTANLSSNDTFMNGLAWSKQNQPESVPLVNFVQVDSKSEAILRVVPLKDALFIFKTDGIWKLTGYFPNFTVERFDSSAILVAPESIAVLNNQIFCLTDQGATVISDAVKVISRPIEQDILQLFGADMAAVQSLTFGVGYETERKYYLWMISTAGETAPTQAYVYNVFTATWVRHTVRASAAVVDENHLYVADIDSAYIMVDRKSYTYLDYADFLARTDIDAVDDLTVKLSGGTDLVTVGDVLYQSSILFSIITGVDAINSTVTVETNPGFVIDSAQLLKAINTNIKWVPVTTGNPAITKQYYQATMLFKSDFNGTGYLTFRSDLSPFDESVPLAGLGLAAWGLFPWGSRPWGGESLRRPIEQWVPRNKQRCSDLTISFQHAYGFSPWQLQGLSVFGTPGSGKVGR